MRLVSLNELSAFIGYIRLWKADNSFRETYPAKPTTIISLFSGFAGLEFLWCLMVACTVISASAQTTENDSIFPDIGKRSVKETVAWREDSLHRKNPVIPGVASLIVPGAGQIITGHYVKASFFIALESIFVGQALYWRSNSDIGDQNAQYHFNSAMRKWKGQDSLDRFNSRLDSVRSVEDFNLDHHGVMDWRFSSYNFTVWAVGAYIYNVLDAINSSNYFKNSEPKKAGTAALLAAVPGLGLGQLYNGSVSKAGMVIMGQFSLGVMAWNSYRLMRDAENNYGRLSAATDSLTKAIAPDYTGRWGSTRYRAFTNRNMYLWYGIFYYFYSMFDATVDAYLHDYPNKMRIEPDLGISEKEIKFSLSSTF